MKITHNLIRTVSLMRRSNWILRALMALALATALLGPTGCSPHPH